MARAFLIIGFLALAIGLLWIGQGTGAIAWPPLELHDQPIAMGRIWCRARRHRPIADLAKQGVAAKAFSSEVHTGSRQENASNEEAGPSTTTNGQ